MKALLKVVLGLSVLLLLGYYLHNQKVQENAIKQEKLQKKQLIIDSLRNIALKYDADYKWDWKLTNNESSRTGKVLTYEIQNLWTASKPIVFIGSLKDVIDTNENNYTVIVERSLIEKPLIMNDLQIKVICHKPLIDKLLENPEIIGDLNIIYRVAFIAQISTIESKDEADGYVITGSGTCLDAMYIGNLDIEL